MNMALRHILFATTYRIRPLFDPFLPDLHLNSSDPGNKYELASEQHKMKNCNFETESAFFLTGQTTHNFQILSTVKLLGILFFHQFSPCKTTLHAMIFTFQQLKQRPFPLFMAICQISCTP